MIRFLRSFELDRLSFWLGFLTGVLLLYLLGKLRPHLAILWKRFLESLRASRNREKMGDEVRWNNDTIRQAQRCHLAAQLFSLDEIVQPPRLLSPPPIHTDDSTPTIDEITDWVIPYLPDWPELASAFNAPTLTPLEALQQGAHLAVIGQPGSGKTVALAHLATQVARRVPEAGSLAGRVPFLIHAADLELPVPDSQSPLSVMEKTVARQVANLPLARLSKLLAATFAEGRALLLVDGLDELPPEGIKQIVIFLDKLLQAYPKTLLAAAASAEYLDGLVHLGFVPLPLATWGETQRSQFIRKWGELWTGFISASTGKGGEPTDPDLINGWLVTDPHPLTPLELTLKTWAAFAGDSLGASPSDAIESYLRRLLPQKDRARRGAEELAAQMTLTLQPVLYRRDAEGWAGGPTSGDDQELVVQEESSPKKGKPTVSVSQIIPDLIESSLIVERAGDRLMYAHPVFCSHLAAPVLASGDCAASLVAQPQWIGRSLALCCLAARSENAYWIQQEWEASLDPLMSGLLQTARWLRFAPEKATWRSAVMRQLAGCLPRENVAYGLRARCLAALVSSGTAGVGVLLRQQLTSGQAEVRQLAALGCGLLRETKASPELHKLLADESINVRRAACLGLVAIGDRPSLEGVAELLLQGDELTRRAAAQALSNHPEEGYPTLQDGSQMEDVLVRRSVVFGLSRVHQPWAIDLLKKIQIEDSQWVVQNAATQVLEANEAGSARIPQPLPPLTHTPWLIQFAGERGIGVVPGKPARELVMMTLKEGTEEQCLAALNYLNRSGDEDALLPLYALYFSSRGELHEAALNTLWHLAASGIPLPPPTQYGFK